MNLFQELLDAMPTPQILLGDGTVGVDISHIDRWAYDNVLQWRQVSGYALEHRMTEDQRMKLLAACLCRALLARQAAALQKEIEAPMRHFTPEFPHEG